MLFMPFMVNSPAAPSNPFPQKILSILSKKPHSSTCTALCTVKMAPMLM